MPMYRFNMRARYNSKDVQPAADLVRYLRREGEFAPKGVERDRDVDYMTRAGVDTVAHDDLVGTPIVGNLPSWAKDATTYFVAASQHERKGGQYAIALQIALPRELTHEQHMALANDFVEAVMHDKPYLLVKHEPIREGRAQPHLHILVGPRTEDGIARSAEQHFRRYNPAHPERGGAQKDRFWNQRQTPRRLREAFSDLANVHLEWAGAVERIDPRSLRKQGIERDRISWGNRIELGPETKAREQANAVAAWEERKVYREMGNIHELSREELRLLVRGWTREREDERFLERRVRTLQTYMQRLQHEQHEERRYAERGMERPPSGRHHAERVLADARSLGLPPDLEAEQILSRSYRDIPLRTLDAQPERVRGRAERWRLFEPDHRDRHPEQERDR